MLTPLTGFLTLLWFFLWHHRLLFNFLEYKLMTSEVSAHWRLSVNICWVNEQMVACSWGQWDPEGDIDSSKTHSLAWAPGGNCGLFWGGGTREPRVSFILPCLLEQVSSFSIKIFFFSSYLVMENDTYAGLCSLMSPKLSPFPCCGFNNASFHKFTDFNVLLLNL